MLRVVEKNLTYAGRGFGPFYGFKAVCLVPFEVKLIDFDLLSKDQVDWLNAYNKEIVEKVTIQNIKLVSITRINLLGCSSSDAGRL